MSTSGVSTPEQPPRREPLNTPGLSRAFTLAVALALTAGAAQGGPDVARQYRAVTGALESAVQARAADPARSLAELARARQLFDALAPAFGSSPLSGGVRDALQNARIAVGRSEVDLEAQTLQARGFLRRALLSAALDGLARGDAGVSDEIEVLADDFALSGDASAKVRAAAQGGRANEVEALLERAAARQIAGALARVNSAGRAKAYLETARATSWFGVVQDSPRAGDLTVDAFTNALASLTKGDEAAFAKQLAALRRSAAQFAAAADRAARGEESAAQPAPAEPVSATKTTSTANPTIPANTVAANTVAPAPSRAASPDTPSSGTPSSDTPSSDTPSLDSLYAPLGRALVESGHGDNAAARLALTEAARDLAALSPAVRAAPGVEALRSDLARAQHSSALRADDVRALLGRLEGAGRAGQGEAPSALERANADLLRTWGGPPRAALFALLALLAFYPLYLLNLAFGGRNPYWRAIGAALFLLLLPGVLEGAANLGSLLEGISGLSAFASLTNLSLRQTPLGDLGLWASLLGAVALASWGFRGICAQFGLLGRRARPEAAQPAVEWDEEL